MRRLVYLPGARRDLLAIHDYIAEASGSTAVGEDFALRLEQQCQKLSRLPGTLGRARPELRHDLRSFPFRGYIIFFRYIADGLEVVNIVERHRDLEVVFTADP